MVVGPIGTSSSVRCRQLIGHPSHRLTVSPIITDFFVVYKISTTIIPFIFIKKIWLADRFLINGYNKNKFKKIGPILKTLLLLLFSSSRLLLWCFSVSHVRSIKNNTSNLSRKSSLTKEKETFGYTFKFGWITVNWVCSVIELSKTTTYCSLVHHLTRYSILRKEQKSVGENRLKIKLFKKKLEENPTWTIIQEPIIINFSR